MKSIHKFLCIFLCGVLVANPLSVFGLSKSEMVYSTLKADGTVQKTTINTKLFDLEKGDVVDYSNLENIQNLNGDEKFSRESSKIVWKSTGKDIYYQGQLKDSLPIKVKVHYYLNDEESTPSKMIGKKGNVRVEFTFQNSDYDFDYGMYVPYVVDMTTILSSEDSSVVVSSGTAVSTGNMTIVTALAAPGLYDNVGLDEFRNLDSITLSFDTNSFQNLSFYFVITPKLLDRIDLEKIESLENSLGQIQTLQDGMNQIVDGSKALSDASYKVWDSAQEFSNNLGMISDGQQILNDNIQTITSSVTDVTSTVQLLNDALASSFQNIEISQEEFQLLPENVQMFLVSLSNLYQTNAQTVATLENFNVSLESTYHIYGLDAMDEATIRAVYTSQGMADKTIELLVNTKKIYELHYESNLELIQSLKEKMKNLFLGEKGLFETISDYLNVIQDSAVQLSTGSQKISDGLDQLYSGSVRLSDVLGQMADSTSNLSSGIEKINSEGISKLSDMSQEGLEYSYKAKELIQLARDYNGFAADNVDFTTFVYKLNTK